MDQIVDYLSDYAASSTFSDLPAGSQPVSGLGSGVPDAYQSIGRLESVSLYGA